MTPLELLKPRDLELGPFTPPDDAEEQASGANGDITVDQLRRKVEASYEEQSDIRYGAARLWVDAILDPVQTRQALLTALEVATRYDDGRPFRTGVLQV